MIASLPRSLWPRFSPPASGPCRSPVYQLRVPVARRRSATPHWSACALGTHVCACPFCSGIWDSPSRHPTFTTAPVMYILRPLVVIGVFAVSAQSSSGRGGSADGTAGAGLQTLQLCFLWRCSVLFDFHSTPECRQFAPKLCKPNGASAHGLLERCSVSSCEDAQVDATAKLGNLARFQRKCFASSNLYIFLSSGFRAACRQTFSKKKKTLTLGHVCDRMQTHFLVAE